MLRRNRAIGGRRVFGYAYVCKEHPKREKQIERLGEVDELFVDEGASDVRPAYDRLLATVRPGDVVRVVEVGCLGANSPEIARRGLALRDAGAAVEFTLSKLTLDDKSDNVMLFRILGDFTEYMRHRLAHPDEFDY